MRRRVVCPRSHPASPHLRGILPASPSLAVIPARWPAHLRRRSRPRPGPPRPRDHERDREAVQPLPPLPSPAVTAQLVTQCTTDAHHFRTANRCVREGRTCRSCFITRSGINYFLVITESRYSGLLNVTMATAI